MCDVDDGENPISALKKKIRTDIYNTFICPTTYFEFELELDNPYSLKQYNGLIL